MEVSTGSSTATVSITEADQMDIVPSLDFSNASNTDTSITEDNNQNPSPEKATGDLQSSGNQEKSSIKVVFMDWVPAHDSSVSSEGFSSSPEFKSDNPVFRPSRYFHTRRGHGVFRPGLGSDPEKFLAKKKSKKRKAPASKVLGDSQNMSKRLKVVPGKPASAILNEFDSNIQYTYDEFKADGTTPSFTCSVFFSPGGEKAQEFVGNGRSKKAAKNHVAALILESLGVHISSPDDANSASEHEQITEMADQPFRMVNTSQLNNYPPVDIDFAADDIINVDFTPTINALSQPMVSSYVVRRLRNIPNLEENICLALNTLVTNSETVIAYENLGDEGPPHDKKFAVKVSFGLQHFVGYGGSKKKAKANAAKQAVLSVVGEDTYNSMLESSLQIPTKTKKQKTDEVQFNSDGVIVPEPMKVEEPWRDDECSEYDLNFSDHINNSIREKYEELMGKDTNYSPFKVLAGVVMTKSSPMIFNSSVISVTTGTKCVEGDFMSEQGLAVNDCHAEILATRCLRDFIFSQIEMYEHAKSDSERRECILQENNSPERSSQFMLKDGIKFHLFISTSPCGDARIFSPKGIEVEETQPSLSPSQTSVEDSHPNKLNRGVLRSKIEAGEGTIPAANLYAGPQTWDSIVSGNALYTMSCSDKVCRWNVLGFQGALLYNLVGSLYYSSITLGSLHHPVHFKRAMYGRIEPLNSTLQAPFSVHQPKLMMVSREEKRRVKKSPNYAVCWATHWSTPEILAANKGRCEPGGVASRLTKRMAFSRFIKLYNTGNKETAADLTYTDAKHLSANYQEAKQEFVSFFLKNNLGPWIGKPIEQDSFKIK